MSSNKYHYVYYEKNLDHELLLIHDDCLDKDTKFISFITFNEIDASKFENNLSTIILTKTITIPQLDFNTVLVIAPSDKYSGANHILHENYSASVMGYARVPNGATVYL
jgi:hypothetical protein